MKPDHLSLKLIAGARKHGNETASCADQYRIRVSDRASDLRARHRNRILEKSRPDSPVSTVILRGHVVHKFGSRTSPPSLIDPILLASRFTACRRVFQLEPSLGTPRAAPPIIACRRHACLRRSDGQRAREYPIPPSRRNGILPDKIDASSVVLFYKRLTKRCGICAIASPPKGYRQDGPSDHEPRTKQKARAPFIGQETGSTLGHHGRASMER